MEVKIVLGFAFGDEGKGVTVQWLCEKALQNGQKPLVARFSGGPQAAHTINKGGVEHICSSFGSGVLMGVPTYLHDNVYVDPISLCMEYDALIQKGITPIISISPRCRIITPYDVVSGRENIKVVNDGSCGKGIYATFDKYKHLDSYPRFGNLMDSPDYQTQLALRIAAYYHGLNRNSHYDEMFVKAVNKLKTIITGVDLNKDVLIFEGSQGLLLDMDRGFYPHVTPARTGLNGINEKYLYDADVYLVTRTYTTRHGSGYVPKYPIIDLDLAYKHETNVNNEFQGNFKIGGLEIDLLNSASERHCLDNYKEQYNVNYNLVVTHMDTICSDGSFTYYVNNYRKSCDPDYDKVIEAIKSSLQIPINRTFYNDSIYSCVKEVSNL